VSEKSIFATLAALGLSMAVPAFVTMRTIGDADEGPMYGFPFPWLWARYPDAGLFTPIWEVAVAALAIDLLAVAALLFIVFFLVAELLPSLVRWTVAGISLVIGLLVLLPVIAEVAKEPENLWLSFPDRRTLCRSAWFGLPRREVDLDNAWDSCAGRVRAERQAREQLKPH
jgi:hypothetical protein